MVKYADRELKTLASIGRRTKTVRHFFVRILAPTLYKSVPAPSFPRPMIEFISKKFEGRPLIGVEIGVAFGKHAKSILETLNIQKLFLVDPYIPYIENNLLETRYVNAFPEAKARLSKFADRIIFVRKTSMDALNDLPNGLDFVYIDGNHGYEIVKKDIELYYNKLRSGAVIGGHDFNISWLGVCKAVIDFGNSNNLELHGKGVDWWFVKR